MPRDDLPEPVKLHGSQGHLQRLSFAVAFIVRSPTANMFSIFCWLQDCRAVSPEFEISAVFEDCEQG